MSHHLDVASNPIIIQVGCPVLGTLTPNQSYLFTGLSQGTFGVFDVLTYSLDADTLSEHVTVFPTNYNLGGYEGLMNWTLCQLEYVQDHLDNQVWGSVNINQFPWFNINVRNNILREASLFQYNPGLTSFTFNVIEENSSLQVLNIVNGFIDGNIFTRESTVIINSQTQVVLDKNIVDKTNMNIGGGLTSTIAIRTSSFENTLLNMNPSRGIHQLSTSNLYSSFYTDDSDTNITIRAMVSESGSKIDILNTAAGANTILVDNLKMSQISNFTIFATTISKDISLSNITLVNGLFQINGLFSPLTTNITIRDIMVVHDSTVLITGSTANETINYQDWFIVNGSGIFTGGKGSVQGLIIENNSLLVTAGFDILRSRLEDANSTLIANISDATKSGYVNVLP